MLSFISLKNTEQSEGKIFSHPIQFNLIQPKKLIALVL